MKTIIKQNTRVNDSIKKAVLDQLMLIFSSIKKIELAVEKQSDRFTPPAVHPIHTASHMYSNSNGDLEGVEAARIAAAGRKNESSVDRLTEMYHEQRSLVLSVGVTTDDIMISALAIMKKICGPTIKNVPQNLPRHNPFTEPTFTSALSTWQNELPQFTGYAVNDQSK